MKKMRRIEYIIYIKLTIPNILVREEISRSARDKDFSRGSKYQKEKLGF
jgi:hypothetical protein